MTIIKKDPLKKNSHGSHDIAESLMGVQLKITVEVGTTRLLIADLLKLKAGEMISLAGNAKDPLKIFVNDKLFAFGEVLEVNGKMAVRVTEVIGKAPFISPAEFKRSA